jgi:hypothetical protein
MLLPWPLVLNVIELSTASKEPIGGHSKIEYKDAIWIRRVRQGNITGTVRVARDSTGLLADNGSGGGY